MFGMSCTNDDPCPDADHPLEDLVTSLITSDSYANEVGFANEAHEYSFRFDTDGILCSVGYESSNTIGDYVIQIKDAQNISLLDESFNFPKGVVTYRAIPEINILANQEYTITRVCVGCQQDSLLIGRVTKATNSPFNPDFDLPKSNLGFTVTSANLFGNDPSISVAVPRIELGFEEAE